MKRAPTRDIVWLFLITRAALVIITYIAYILLTAPKYSSTGVNIAALLTSWDHWDAARYLHIAQFGYQTRFDTAFFPLFPLLTALFAYPFGPVAYLPAATLISNGALLGTLFILYQLAVEAGGEPVARRTLLYLCIFPTAFFFFAPYNESLFLLFVTGAFLAMRRQRWWTAGLLGMLASLTRSAGLLLVAPYLYELWASHISFTTGTERLQALRKCLPIILIPLGVLLYSLYCWYMSGDPFAYATVQSHWGRHLDWPWTGLMKQIGEFFWQPFGSFFEVHDVLDFSATLGFIALTSLGWRRLRTSYNLWITSLVCYVLISPAIDTIDPLVSNQRFMLEMFPLFIVLASFGIKHPRLHQTLLILFPMLLTVLSILFLMNYWMV
jgi:Gpi18-like mannosyltransferase